MQGGWFFFCFFLFFSGFFFFLGGGGVGGWGLGGRGVQIGQGAFHLVRTQFYMLSGPTHPLFACITQWKCIGGLTPPNPPRCVRTKWQVPSLVSLFMKCRGPPKGQKIFGQ